MNRIQLENLYKVNGLKDYRLRNTEDLHRVHSIDFKAVDGYSKLESLQFILALSIFRFIYLFTQAIEILKLFTQKAISIFYGLVIYYRANLIQNKTQANFCCHFSNNLIPL